ncbi:restriction endonuclease subunit S [Streptococcus sp. DTU_2020_1001019_1_SI_AUS_MUR_006]|uniref:restriction endonuclease subunit S n=1 Tax=Streptococcus TaxID=1301 RepID=UPI0028EEDB8F|nr:restriction endonuclease subunit S [Streptococcus sp. DTU_2020_1001019_1_SI_AUS_MUR_006]WNS72227.1 restriction endonuclease subunit S [Streptococcus sp. DTU_2020_1001019_1_SI_AUS_MUR_006]
MPLIRVSEIKEEWLYRDLKEVKDVRDGTHSSPKYIENGYPLVTSKNLTDSGLNLCDASLISESDYNEINKRSKVEVGDILLGLIGTIGKPVLVDSDGFAIKNVGLIKNSGEIQNQFLLQYLKTNLFNKYIQIEMAGNTQKFLGLETLRNTKVPVPSQEEQSAIGSLFRTLDDLLASYKDNLANYQSLKATMLSKMFPKAGQTVPEIRMDGFEGKWQKYYLGDIFEQVSNYIEPSVENELWSLTVEKGLTPKTDRYKRDFLVKKNDKFKKVNLNEFVYNPMNLTLGALDLNNNEVTISVSGYYIVIKNRDIEKFDNDFLKILLKTMYAIYQYKQFATGSLIEKQRVQFPTFSEIPFYLPPIAEQQAIGAYFSNLDNLINSYQEKISQLETLKKKLLQDMFI